MAIVKRETQPVACNGGEEFIDALITFASTYIPEIKARLFAYADEIASNETVRTLLLEYNRRHKKCEEDYRRSAEFAIKNGLGDCGHFAFEENTLDHPSSYRDVIDDLLRPYFPKDDQQEQVEW